MTDWISWLTFILSLTPFQQILQSVRVNITKQLLSECGPWASPSSTRGCLLGAKVLKLHPGPLFIVSVNSTKKLYLKKLSGWVLCTPNFDKHVLKRIYDEHIALNSCLFPKTMFKCFHLFLIPTRPNPHPSIQLHHITNPVFDGVLVCPTFKLLSVNCVPSSFIFHTCCFCLWPSPAYSCPSFGLIHALAVYSATSCTFVCVLMCLID